MPPDALNALRAEIDVLDARIVALIGERFACTDKVGQLKSTHQLRQLMRRAKRGR